MSTLAIALRNLMRNRRRSLATLFAMMIGAVSILLFGGYVRNIVYGLQTGYVQEDGHLQLQHRDYFLYGCGDPTAYGIVDYRRVIEILRRDPVLASMLTVVTPTLEFGGIAGNFAAGVSRTVMASGVVVEDQNALRLWNDYGFPGGPDLMPLTGTAADAAVIGTGVARVLRLCAPLKVADCPSPAEKPQAAGAELPADVATLAAEDAPAVRNDDASSAGARIELLAATASGAPNVARLQVAKAEGQGVKQLDDIYVSLHLAQAQRLLYGSAPPQATAIALQLHHTREIPAARARLQQLLATTLRDWPLAVYDFETLHPYYGQTVGLFSAIFGFIALLIGAIVLFTVGNTMNAAVVERTVEIGTLRAIGLRRSGIRRLFVCEGILIGVLGASLGVAAALILAWVINHSGLTWTPPGRIDPIHLHVRVWGEVRMLVATAIGLTAVAVVSAWWPARRASRLQVVEALRHV
jgi:putative ABC transport system permease protein